ncbi:TPA: hypothetical protein NG567_001414 [Vibrio parahaemolyticus]|nr:hypothetical protein [Vibrio parahaemolyticus]
MNILITCYSLANFSGSECMVFDFSKELISLGHDVNVASYHYDFPIKSCFEPSGIEVDFGEDIQYVKKFDLVISFHSFFLKLLLANGLIADKFVYFSLSPFEEFETPITSKDTSDIFCRGYFNSDESRKHHLDNSGVEYSSSSVFPNSVTQDYFDFSVQENKGLRRVCVVSNHPPEELIELKGILSKEGIELFFIGRSSQGYSRYIEPSTLSKFDAVITIGRTVQYCMALGVPVFIYDRFGGPGYLSEDNYDEEYKVNFSGRSYQNRLCAAELSEKVINGYNSYNISTLRDRCADNFNLKKNLSRMIFDVEQSPKVCKSLLRSFSYDAPVYLKLLRINRKLESRSLNLTKQLNLIRSNSENNKQEGMRLAISYNFFNGEEYFYQNAFNMRPLADHISIVYQKVSNCGNPISKSALNVLHKIIRNGLVDEVVLYTPDDKLSPSENEYRKRKLGERIAREHDCTHFMSMDSDEFYERNKFRKAKEYILKNNISYSSCSSYFYIKKPTYRSKSRDSTNVAFICKLDGGTEFMRGGFFPISNVDPTRRICNKNGRYFHFPEEDIVMHHMNFIRNDGFKSKLSNSSNAHKSEFMKSIKISLDEWKFGDLFRFPNKGDFEIVEVENLFSLPMFDLD